jgi:transposase
MPITARIAAIEAIREGASDGAVAERFAISLRAVRRMRHGLQTGAAAVDLEVLRGLVGSGAVDGGAVD